MVSLDSMNDNGLLAITAGKLGADDGMRTLDVVVNCLAQVVQQAGALGGHNVQAKLGSHHAAQVRDFEGVLKHCLLYTSYHPRHAADRQNAACQTDRDHMS